MKIHIVKSSEELGDIARRYKRNEDEIIRINQLRQGGNISPGQCLMIPAGSRLRNGSIEICAFATAPVALDVLRESLPYYTYLSCCGYYPLEDGAVKGPLDMQLVSYARERDCLPLLCLGNNAEDGAYSGSIAHRIFTEERLREKLFENLLSVLKSRGFSGIHLCFNYLFPFDRDNYSEFVRGLAEFLHNQGYSLSVELVPKDGPGRGSALSAAQDQEALGRYADRLSLMTCRWGHACSPPQAPAPVMKLRQALEYTVSLVPPEKLLMGMSCHGFDWQLPWQQGNEARELGHDAAAELASARRAEIRFDTGAQAPFYEYSDPLGLRHRVYFEDGRSLRTKLGLVEEFSLAGISLYGADRLCRPLLALAENMYSVEKLI